MYERVLSNIIKEGIKLLAGNDALLRMALGAPNWEESELDTLVEEWKGDKKPRVFHGFARAGAQLPSYAVVLTNEQETGEYLDAGGVTYVDEISAFVEEVEAALGTTVDVEIRRFQFGYQVFTFAEHPDVALAYYNALRSIFLGAFTKLTAAGFENPSYSGMDLSPQQQYLPENVFARVLSVSGYAHVLTAAGVSLGPWATRRATRVEGIHVANAVRDVVALVTPKVK